jgi:ribosomal protein L37E
MFEGRKLIIATKHQKEQVIAPLLEQALGVHCFTDETFDTDTLGTFTGEVERALDPIATVREKCLRAMRLNNYDLGIASEGSFGPHPSFFFVSADDEFLIFIDLANKVEVIVRELSTETNFNGKAVQTEAELLEFAQSVGFPSHGLILRNAQHGTAEMYKGIVDLEDLKTSFEQLQAKYPSVYVETDMRAMYNPSRMKVIQKAAEKLVARIKSTCPECHMPGFGITGAQQGLRCSLCGLPTNSIRSYSYQCQHCDFSQEDLYPEGKTSEDPMYCDNCNP